LPDQALDLIVTDPPFFDNVHYSELADFFNAWRQLTHAGANDSTTTRSSAEVQDADADNFAVKLKAVFKNGRAQCPRIHSLPD
jgi:putative DNA methylase